MTLSISVAHVLFTVQLVLGLFFAFNAIGWAFWGMTKEQKKECLDRTMFFGMIFLVVRSFS